MHTYRRLLIHSAILSNTGNCIAQDQTKILTVSSTHQPIEISDINILRKSDEEIEDISQKIKIVLPLHLNEFTENVISYISGFVIKVIQKQIRCSACIEALRFSEVDEADRTLKLISRKTRGGLIIPSHSVREVCRKIEKKIQITIKICGNLPPKDTFIKLLMDEVESLLLNDNIFVS